MDDDSDSAPPFTLQCSLQHGMWIGGGSHKGLVPATLMGVVRQEVMEESGEDVAQTPTGAARTAVICQHQACLCDCLCGQAAVVACSYQGTSTCSC